MSPYNYPYIRDILVIDDDVQRFVTGWAGQGPIFLIAREVRHQPGGAPLRVNPEHPIIVVADLYDGTGGAIDASGTPSGAAGTAGTTGVYPNPAFQLDPTGGPYDIPIAPGGDGGGGGTGGVGGTGGTVTVYCRRTVNTSISVVGGPGAPGGPGGNGSAGVHGVHVNGYTETIDNTPDDLSDFDYSYVEVPERTILGTPGGNGGYGGTGGTGGQGGVISFVSVVDDNPPSLSAYGGAGGPAGPGGAQGPDGALSEVTAAPGSEGTPGDQGGAGQVSQVTVTEEQYVAGLRAVLDGPWGSYANHWAPYRIVVADYHYHRHNPLLPEDPDPLRLAAVELTRALELQPDNAEALRLQAQLVGVPRVDESTGAVVWVGGGNNALGLPEDFDVVPRFEDYIEPFTAFGSQVLTFLEIATDSLLGATTLDGLQRIASLQTTDARVAAQNLGGDLAVAETERRLATDAAAYADQQLRQTTQEIQAALDEMADSPFELGAFLGTVAEVGVAVIGVAAAVTTGGAALVALVPAFVALADAAEPVATALFTGEDYETSEVKKAYDKVEKDGKAVVGAGRKIVDFVKVVQKLTAATTPDNAKHVALVKRGTELAHEVLLAGHQVALAGQRLENVRAKLSRAEGVVQQGDAMVGDLGHDAASVRRIGLLAISVAQSRADALLDMAFRAQRSVEIYTLEPQRQNLHLDAGLLHPDRWREYEQDEIDGPELNRLLVASWDRLLDPIRMQSSYVDFFTPPPGQDQLRLSFEADDVQLAQMRDTGRFSFRVEPTSVRADAHDAKVQSVGISLIGATHPDLTVSCDLRHGGRYEQRRADGTIGVQLLKPQSGTRFAQFVPLTPQDLPPSDEPLDAPRSLAIWGRGIGGDWDVSIVADPANTGLDLSGLSRIQVWIGYQFRQ